MVRNLMMERTKYILPLSKNSLIRQIALITCVYQHISYNMRTFVLQRVRAHDSMVVNSLTPLREILLFSSEVSTNDRKTRL